MLKRRQIFILAITLLSISSSNSYASTDWIVNAMDTANGILKEITSQYESFSTKAQEFITSKTGKLGDINKLAKVEQAKKTAEERLKKLKEHQEKLQARVAEKQAWREAKKKRLAESIANVSKGLQ